ncbi:MAG: hypothetical protein RL456_3242 [Pseudomonadota bacterium]|jgi:hypothetical protein
MALTPLPLLRNITPRSTVLPTAVYGRRQRPWCSGYNMRVSAEGAAKLAGVNHPGESSPRTLRLRGAGAADGTGIPTYAVTLPSGVTLPQTDATDIQQAEAYLNAIVLVYAPGDRANAVVVPRFGVGASAPADNLGYGWKVKDADEIYVWSQYRTSGTLYSDVPAGYQIDLIIPPTATAGGKDDVPVVLKTWTAVAGDTARVCDFLAVGDGTNATTVACNRIFQ